MSNISGNAGQAGATVWWAIQDFSSHGTVTADGSGNYTITGLANGQYFISVSKVGFTFSTTQQPTISGGNVTGINFTATPIPTLVFTQLAAETFTEANANPLNPARWTISSSFIALQVLSNKCQSTGTPGTDDCAESYTGISFPANQYIEAKIAALTGDATSELILAVLADSTGLVSEGMSLSNNGDGTGTFALFDHNDNFLFVAALPFSIGDVFRVAFIGTQLIVYQNGTQVAGGNDVSPPSSGAPNIFMSPNASLTDVQVTNFAAGSVTSLDKIYSSDLFVVMNKDHTFSSDLFVLLSKNLVYNSDLFVSASLSHDRIFNSDLFVSLSHDRIFNSDLFVSVSPAATSSYNNDLIVFLRRKIITNDVEMGKTVVNSVEIDKVN